ncbi:MAG: hypothetical protein AAB870_01275 [Patescibacteria group bacterium]
MVVLIRFKDILKGGIKMLDPSLISDFIFIEACRQQEELGDLSEITQRYPEIVGTINVPFINGYE